MASKKEIKLDRVVFEKGNRKEGFIDIAQAASGDKIVIPVIEIKGKEEGPLFLCDSMIHGDEYEGSEAILQVAEYLEKTEFKGTFVGIPALNVQAYCANTRSSPTDQLNMNRIFPGAQKYITQRIAAKYFDDVMKKADFIISFHGGGNVLHLDPLCGYFPPIDEVGKKTFEMAKAFGVKYTWRMQNIPFEGASTLEAVRLGIPTLTPEIGSHCGRLHDWKENVELCRKGIINVMKFTGMLSGEIPKLDDQIDIQLQYIHTNDGGRHELLKDRGEYFKEGETLARIKDIFGKVVSEVKAPNDGVVLGFYSVPVINPGDWSYLIGKIL